MGIDVAAKGSSKATMNVVPLIDILLVLIIIFMVITPLTPNGLPALIPQPAKTDTKNSVPIKTIVVQLFDTGVTRSWLFLRRGSIEKGKTPGSSGGCKPGAGGRK